MKEQLPSTVFSLSGFEMCSSVQMGSARGSAWVSAEHRWARVALERDGTPCLRNEEAHYFTFPILTKYAEESFPSEVRAANLLPLAHCSLKARTWKSVSLYMRQCLPAFQSLPMRGCCLHAKATKIPWRGKSGFLVSLLPQHIELQLKDLCS